MRTFNVPLIIVGGGGYTVRNVARTWAFETGLAAGVEMGADLPFNEYLEYFGPEFKLDVPRNNMENSNSREYLEQTTWVFFFSFNSALDTTTPGEETNILPPHRITVRPSLKGCATCRSRRRRNCTRSASTCPRSMTTPTRPTIPTSTCASRPGSDRPRAPKQRIPVRVLRLRTSKRLTNLRMRIPIRSRGGRGGWDTVILRVRVGRGGKR